MNALSLATRKGFLYCVTTDASHTEYKTVSFFRLCVFVTKSNCKMSNDIKTETNNIVFQSISKGASVTYCHLSCNGY